jgi:glycosidase/MoaA/NifB/PqqE/SkfB family radical SAM enzyme
VSGTVSDTVSGTVSDALRQIDEDFRSAERPRGPPTRLLVNLSERCQLRCTHCITDAPRKTADGTARDLDPRVFERLRSHLHAVEYLALVHAGEPMLAPLFAPLLDALREARRDAGRPPSMVHLLSNGMAMTEARFDDAIARGVRSLSISLDGMHAATNDVLRIGSRIDLLLPRLRSMRQRAARDQVRLGVSFVVTRANIGELDALVDFVADAQLDWLKLEEVFAHNDAARALVVDRFALDVAVARARERCEQRNVVLVDHTRQMHIWKCRFADDARAQRFSAADEFANGVDINPCRLPWEQLCLEPNGDCKPVSFHAPVGGNVLAHDLLDIWRDGGAFIDARAAVRTTRLCGLHGPTTCPPDTAVVIDRKPAQQPGVLSHVEAKHSVRFEVDAHPGAAVFLVGDFPDWKTHHPMQQQPGAPGRFGLVLSLPAGVYRYRFLVDGQWRSDPHVPVERRDEAEGFDNAVVVVGGATAPFLFAPDAAHVRVDGDSLYVHAELVAPSARDAVVWIDGDAGARRSRLEEVHRAGQRSFLVGHIEHAATATHFGVSLVPAAPRSGTAGFARPATTAAERALDTAPDWLDGAMLYSIFVDRWCRGSSSPPPDRRVLSRRTPSTPDVFYGGDLAGVREHLPWLETLGIDAVVLSPLHHSDSPHHYDPITLCSVDERLGGERELAALIDACHRRGIKLIVDVSLTHVSKKHPAFDDLIAKQQNSRFANGWFRVRRFPVVLGDPTTVDCYYNVPDQPWLDLSAGTPARQAAIEAAVWLVERGVDGLRLDAVDDAPADFWPQLRRACRAKNAEVALLGESVHDRLAHRLGAAGGLDLVTDFRVQRALVDWIADRRCDGAGLAHVLLTACHRSGPWPAARRLAFVDNHDTARLLSLCGGDVARLEVALSVLLFLPEVACLTWGTECLLAAHKGRFALDAAWPERLPMPDPGADHAAWRTGTSALITAAIGNRKMMKAAGAGRLIVLEARGQAVVLMRVGNNGERFLLGANPGDVAEHTEALGLLPPRSVRTSNRDSAGRPMGETTKAS